MNDIQKAFNNFKNSVYNNDVKKLKMTEIALLIKKNKNLKLLKKIYKLTLQMILSIKDLGTKITDLNNEIRTNNLNIKKFDYLAKEIIIDIDVYIDSLIIISNDLKLNKTKFEIKSIIYYLKTLRSKLINMSIQYKIEIAKNEKVENNYFILISDIVDEFIKYSYSMRLLVLNKKLEEILLENDRK